MFTDIANTRYLNSIPIANHHTNLKCIEVTAISTKKTSKLTEIPGPRNNKDTSEEKDTSATFTSHVWNLRVPNPRIFLIQGIYIHLCRSKSSPDKTNLTFTNDRTKEPQVLNEYGTTYLIQSDCGSPDEAAGNR